MKAYSKAPDEVAERAQRLISEYHSDLKVVDIKIDFISVTNSDEFEPALTHAGYPAAAVVKIIGSKDRAAGRGDAEIVIDELSYNNLPDASKDALIDHELYHLEVKRNRHGQIKRDEHERPKLQMRLHDRQLGWFDEIARRHGSASMECKQAANLFLSAKQTYFEFDLNMKSELEDGITAKVELVG